jgi:hypothetical protein
VVGVDVVHLDPQPSITHGFSCIPRSISHVSRCLREPTYPAGVERRDRRAFEVELGMRTVLSASVHARLGVLGRAECGAEPVDRGCRVLVAGGRGRAAAPLLGLLLPALEPLAEVTRKRPARAPSTSRGRT